MKPRPTFLCIALAASLLAITAAQAQPTLTKPPVLETFVEASYPEAEKAEGRSAAVTLRLLIAIDGNVADVTVVESAGEAFDTAAVAAARQFKFAPAEVDGSPSAIRILYRYEFKLEVIKPKFASLAGLVRDAVSKAPAPEVLVRIDSPALDAPRTVETGSDGLFAFNELPASPVTVSLSKTGTTPRRTTEQLSAGERLEVVYEITPPPPPDDEDIEEDDLEVVVVAPPSIRQVASTEVRVEEAKKVPGISGDVVRVVEALPGVARSTVGSGQLVIWGSAPGESRVYVDGVPIPRLYHEGGWRTVIQPEFVTSVEFIPGGQAASWGRAIGGIIAVNTEVPASRTVQGSVSADSLDGAAMVSASVAEHWRVAASARYSYYDLWAKSVIPEEDQSFAPLAQYRDGQLRVRFAPSSRESFELVGMLGFDSYQRGVPNDDPALSSRDTRSLNFQRTWLRYRSESTTGSATWLTLFGGADQSLREELLGATGGNLDTHAVLAGVRAGHRAKLLRELTIEIGIDAEVRHATLAQVGSIGLPSRIGDLRIFGQPAPDQIGNDNWKSTDIGIAPYAQLVFRTANDRLDIMPGIRLDPYVRYVSQRVPRNPEAPTPGLYAQNFAAEPRFALRYRAAHWVALRAATGLYHQPPDASDLSAVFGNPALPTSQGVHVVAGADFSIADLLTVEITAYLKLSSDLSVRSSTETPALAKALVPSGDGRAYGGQVMFRQKAWRGFSWWLSYTFSVAERRFNRRAEWLPFNLDQRHALSAFASYELPLGFSVGTRLRLSTGFPRTPVIGAYFDARRDRFQPVFGDQNSDRLPIFVQLDLRAAKEFTFDRHGLSIYLEVQNVWNQENSEEFVFSPDFSRRGSITSLPVLPMMGVQWTF